MTRVLLHVPVELAADATGVVVTVNQLGLLVGVATFGTLYLNLAGRLPGHPALGAFGRASAVPLAPIASLVPAQRPPQPARCPIGPVICGPMSRWAGCPDPGPGRSGTLRADQKQLKEPHQSLRQLNAHGHPHLSRSAHSGKLHIPNTGYPGTLTWHQ